jgi:hypothetical protein
MRDRYNFDPKVTDSFYAYADTFKAVTDEHTATNPAATIIDVALNRVSAEAELSLPSGIETATLEDIYDSVSRFGETTTIFADQAQALAQIGRQVLALNVSGHIQPPLDSSPFNTKESAVISHLIEVVEA